MDNKLSKKLWEGKRKLLGTGAFTKAYKVESLENTCILSTTDPLREVLYFASAEGCYDNKHLPRYIERESTEKEGKTLYAMELYKKVDTKKLNKTSLKNYKALLKFEKERMGKGVEIWGSYDSFLTWVKRTLRKLGVTKKVREALVYIYEEASNYTERPMLETPKRNLAMDGKGNLILLDVVFCRNALERSWGY